MRWVKRITGILLVFLASASLLFSMYLLIQIWRIKQPLTDSLVTNFSLLSTALDTSDQALTLIGQALTNTSTTITELEDSTQSLALSANNASLALDSFVILFGKDLPATITNTQASIASAQSSAVIIDNVLTTLSGLPLLNLSYDPSQPLNASLGQISASLGGLPKSLKSISKSLKSTSTSMQTLQTQILDLSTNLGRINQNLVQGQEVVNQYKNEVSQLKAWIQSDIKAIPGWVSRSVWLSTFIIIWLATTQISLLINSLALIRATF